MVLRSAGSHNVAAVALAAALVHLVAHTSFKTLGFLAAGSVLAATGIRDIDRLGGLARRMPGTTIAFGVAALGASGLPLGAGFVGEWLLLQSLIHTPHDGHTLLALAVPLAVGTVALTTGLGVAAMVKGFGVGFLARPRSDAAAAAREVPASMLTGMGLAAAVCGVLAAAPGVLGPVLRRVLGELLVGGQPRLGVTLRLPGIAGSISPVVLAVALVTAALLALALTLIGSRRRPAGRAAALWACGGRPADPPDAVHGYVFCAAPAASVRRRAAPGYRRAGQGLCRVAVSGRQGCLFRTAHRRG
jgi:formate hydrogenlyase subunit 3/multisubunit Na+/H+ antiporter MnhD subunit